MDGREWTAGRAKSGSEGRMRVYFSQAKTVMLCVSLLSMLAPALAGCGGCSIAAAAPGPVALTVEDGVVYSSGGVYIYGAKVFALRASDGTVLWQNAENPYVGEHGEITGIYQSGAPVAPVVDGQSVIETMGIGLFAVLRAADGKMLWHSRPLTGLAASAGGARDYPPVVADGVIYAAAGYGTIAAWDEHDGQSLWVSHFAPDAEVAAPTSPTYRYGLPQPVMAGSTIYASAGHSVYALRAADGSVLWHLPAAPVGIIYSTPVVTATAVYVNDSDGTVFALDPETGTIRWRSPANSSIVMEQPLQSVVVQGQTVFVASDGNLVRALNAATGAQLWRYVTRKGDTLVAGPLAPLTVGGGRVYLASFAFGLYDLDATTGRQLWLAPLDPAIFNTWSRSPSTSDLAVPTIDQATVVVAANNGVGAWRVSDGQELWLAHIPDEADPGVVDSSAVASGMVYVAQGGTGLDCGNGPPPRVLALRGSDGKQLWQVSI